MFPDAYRFFSLSHLSQLKSEAFIIHSAFICYNPLTALIKKLFHQTDGKVENWKGIQVPSPQVEWLKVTGSSCDLLFSFSGCFEKAWQSLHGVSYLSSAKDHGSKEIGNFTYQRKHRKGCLLSENKMLACTSMCQELTDPGCLTYPALKYLEILSFCWLLKILKKNYLPKQVPVQNTCTSDVNQSENSLMFICGCLLFAVSDVLATPQFPLFLPVALNSCSFFIFRRISIC